MKRQKIILWIGSLLGLGFVTFLILFAVENHNKVAVTLPIIPGGLILPHVTFFKVVYVSVGLGFLSGMFLCWIGGLRHRRQILQLSRKNRDLEQEVVSLRNLPFD